jgi:hypothetical protein
MVRRNSALKVEKSVGRGIVPLPDKVLLVQIGDL